MFESGEGINDRKSEHIQHCRSEKAYFSGEHNSLDYYELVYDALPELNFADIQIQAHLQNRTFSAPILVGSMTGGCKEAIAINHTLARFCTEHNLPLALGSCRAYLENGSHPRSFELKQEFSDLPFLFGNLGAVQLNYGIGIPEIGHLIEKLRLDGLIFHLNPLQEAVQDEGDKNFQGLVEKLTTMAEHLNSIDFPVSIKEVGAGISLPTAAKLSRINPDIVEVAGKGGTSWAYVESLRSKSKLQQHLGDFFKHFGVQTVESLQNMKKTDYKGILIASGGLRNGMDIFKCLCLGANFTAMAHPFLRAATADIDQNTFQHLPGFYQRLTSELKLSCFLTGTRDVKTLVENNGIGEHQYVPKVGNTR